MHHSRRAVLGVRSGIRTARKLPTRRPARQSCVRRCHSRARPSWQTLSCSAVVLLGASTNFACFFCGLPASTSCSIVSAFLDFRCWCSSQPGFVAASCVPTRANLTSHRSFASVGRCRSHHCGCTLSLRAFVPRECSYRCSARLPRD